jgi:CHAT domain-containing protein
LLDLLATVQSPSSPPAAVPSPESLRAELFKIEQQLGMESSPSARLSLIREQARVSWALQQGSYQGLRSASPLSETEIQGLIEEIKSPVVVFFSAPQELWSFVLLPGSPEPIVLRTVIGRDELAKGVRHLVHDLANPLYEERARDQQRDFWDLLIAPWLDQLPAGTKHLTLIPHGALHELPFESLLDPAGTFLLNRVDVSVAPSLSALARARGRHKESQKGDSLVALWAPEFFAKTVGVELIKATFDSYRQAAGRASVILFATNGVHVEGSVSQTYLEIGATKGVHDSRLTAAEIVTIPLQAELVALAACDTSYGRALLSDERLDLTRSFLIAGAAAVLGARWKVPDDERTNRFLKDFFEIYRQGGPGGAPMRKDEALSEARRHSQARQDPAQVWAAWVLVGDPR